MVDWNSGDGRRNTSLTETNKDEGEPSETMSADEVLMDKVYSLAHSTKEREDEISPKDRTGSSVGSTNATTISQGCTGVHHAQ